MKFINALRRRDLKLSMELPMSHGAFGVFTCGTRSGKQSTFLHTSKNALAETCLGHQRRRADFPHVSFLILHRAEVTSLAARYSLPAVYPYRQFPEIGGLLSYGFDRLENWRRAASYVDRILK